MKEIKTAFTTSKPTLGEGPPKPKAEWLSCAAMAEKLAELAAELAKLKKLVN